VVVREPLGRERGPHERLEVGDERPERHLLDAVLHLPGVEPREAQHVGHEPHQVALAHPDPPERGALRVGDRPPDAEREQLRSSWLIVERNWLFARFAASAASRAARWSVTSTPVPM
jgi:hypothetical protein